MIDLIVIGAGPTGVAALHFAKRAGLTAIGLESGTSPLADVHTYPTGLVLLSSPLEYQVGNIPLDCRDPSQLTREEVLNYYARIIELGQLRIEVKQRCVALTPGPRGVSVTTASAGGTTTTRNARNVLVTAWYGSQQLRIAKNVTRPRVVQYLTDPSQVAGQEVVILGGGFSAFEHAHALMTLGKRVHVVARGRLDEAFDEPQFQRLSSATGSQLIERGTSITVDQGSVSFGSAPGTHRRIDCDVVVCCYGRRIQSSILRVLNAAGVLDAGQCHSLRRAKTADDLVRSGIPSEVAVEQVMASHPDLYQQLVHGHRGIRLAGGALHIGGSHAGVPFSIGTADLAIRSIAGLPLPPGLKPPLARSLPEVIRRRPDTMSPGALRDISLLIPLRIGSWSRTWPKIRFAEAHSGSRVPSSVPLGLAQNVPPGLKSVVQQVLSAADGTRNVRRLLQELAPSGSQRLAVGQLLLFLWRNNGLTWIPPGRPAR